MSQQMELVLKGRGLRLTEQIRRTIEHKLAKLARLDPRGTRIEVELILERNPRIDGSHRVEVAFVTRRRVFRAEGAGQGVDGALDQVIERLERQVNSHRDRMKDRRQTGPIV